ncbi:hypothetical protein F4778DRAFT_789932 [Xylariomycetidae sp. FL2044]|nr:hypothetical protein F4778DRAFT_789932 [Xylariomycetidae sp. FL2044]
MMLGPDFATLPFDQQVELYNTLPALAAPEGVIPSYDHPRLRNDVTIPVLVISLTLTTVLFALRLYSRLFVVKKFRLEDYIGLAGYMTYIASCVVISVGVHKKGFLAHQWDLLMERFVEVLKFVQAESTAYNLTMMLSKVAILLEWSHVFVPHPMRNAFYWTCHALIWASICFYCSITVVQHLQCIPYIKIWYAFVPGHCIEAGIIYTFAPAFNLLIDLVILVFPQRTIWRLNMGLKRRVAVSVLFSSGILAIVFGAARVVVATRAIYDDDFLWLGSQSALFCIAEMTFSYVIFCLPAVPSSVHENTITTLPNRIWSKVISLKSRTERQSRDSRNFWPISDFTSPSSNTLEMISFQDSKVQRQEVHRNITESLVLHHVQAADIPDDIESGLHGTNEFLNSVKGHRGS